MAGKETASNIHCTVDEWQHTSCSPPHSQRMRAVVRRDNNRMVGVCPVHPRGVRANHGSLQARREVSDTAAYALRPVAAQGPS